MNTCIKIIQKEGLPKVSRSDDRRDSLFFVYMCYEILRTVLTEESAAALSSAVLFQKLDDLIVAGADFFHGYIVVDDIHDAGQIFAHICLDIIRTFQKLLGTVIQVRSDQAVQIAFFVVFVKFVQTIGEQAVGGADEYAAGIALY